jgi:hypothetical protein
MNDAWVMGEIREGDDTVLMHHRDYRFAPRHVKLWGPTASVKATYAGAVVCKPSLDERIATLEKRVAELEKKESE